MTTIAHDGVILAIDQGMWVAGSHVQVNKMFEIRLHDEVIHHLRLTDTTSTDDYIIALCGDWAEINAWVRWFLNGGKPPEVKDTNDAIGLLMLTTYGAEKTYMVFGNATVTNIVSFPVALGSGCDVALGAMWVGACAWRAVEVAIQNTNYAARGVSYFDTNFEYDRHVRSREVK